MSFPGGRYQKREIGVGKRIGYEIFFTSRIGTISSTSLHNNFVFDRVPIKNGMKLNTFLSLAQGRAIPIWMRKVSYRCKLAVKILLGDRLYHGLYRKLIK